MGKLHNQVHKQLALCGYLQESTGNLSFSYLGLRIRTSLQNNCEGLALIWTAARMRQMAKKLY